jgi:hypothetical protein
MKKGKELKIEQFRNYNIVYGSVNNKAPKAIYINISAWADPRTEGEIRYGRIIRNLDKEIRQALFNELSLDVASPFAKDRTIIDFDIRESGIKYGKRSFINCEITLYLNYEIPVNSEYLMPIVEDIVNVVIKNIFESNKNFTFHKKKK